jgi:hypothetical protein
MTPGWHVNGEYNHVLPADLWELGLWKGIATASAASRELNLPSYLVENDIKRHTGSHNLLSSWVLCANLYFPFRLPGGRKLLTPFLAHTISAEILEVTGVELEYAADDVLKPSVLLGEDSGGRGSGQTSPDVGFTVRTKQGPGIVLAESKYTEHWFYGCSGYKKHPKGREPNPDRTRCLDFGAVLASPASQCHLVRWKRRYWEHLDPVVDRAEAVSQFSRCPAANGAYQLLRQQALAEGFASSARFSFVASTVAYHERNDRLFSIRGRDGVIDLRSVWPRVFRGSATFTAFTHQSWVSWVRAHDSDGAWRDWSEYLANRYRM